MLTPPICLMQLLNDFVTATTNGATAVAVDGQRCLPEEVWKIVSASFQNNSGELVQAQFQVNSTRGATPVSMNYFMQSGDTIALPEDIYLGEGENLRVSSTGLSLSGPVELYYVAERHLISPDTNPKGGSSPGE